jgi:membrane protein DedA with SNARE-associated domain
MQGHIIEIISAWGALAVFFIVGLESAGVPLPGEATLVTAAVFAGTQGGLKIEWVIFAAAAGAITGDNLGYWVGREFGFPLLLKYGGYVRIDEKRLKLGQYLFQQYGGSIVFFGRFVAFLRVFAALLAGVNRFAWPRFFLFNSLGGAIWATIFGLGGFFLGHAFERYARPVGIAALVCVVAGALLASRFIAAQEKILSARAEAALPGPLAAPTRVKD